MFQVTFVIYPPKIQTALEYFSCDERAESKYRIRAVKREELRRRRLSDILQDRERCLKQSAASIKVPSFFTA